jgi:hypothetical protein
MAVVCSSSKGADVASRFQRDRGKTTGVGVAAMPGSDHPKADEVHVLLKLKE